PGVSGLPVGLEDSTHPTSGCDKPRAARWSLLAAAEESAEQAALLLGRGLGERRRRRLRLRLRRRRRLVPARRVRHAASRRRVVQFALQPVDLALQGAAALESFEFVADLALDALEVVALAGHLGPLAGHANLHLAHLFHQRLLVLLQLAAL